MNGGLQGLMVEKKHLLDFRPVCILDGTQEALESSRVVTRFQCFTVIVCEAAYEGSHACVEDLKLLGLNKIACLILV